jgi:hypothetical protein
MGDEGELRGVRFFDAVLDAAAIDAMRAASRQVTFRRGEVLMRQGEPGASMFTIVSGNVIVSVQERDGDHTVAELGPDDYVGEMSLLTGEPRTATSPPRAGWLPWRRPRPRSSRSSQRRRTSPANLPKWSLNGRSN